MVITCPHCGTANTDLTFCQKCGAPLSATGRADTWRGRTVGGRYRLLQRIGQGGMGVVWEAEHQAMGQKVAIKFLHASFSGDPEVVRRFRNEARSYARLVHPHAIQLHDFGEDEDGNLYIVMEYVEGSDLRKVLQAEKRLPPAEALDVLLQVADVVQAAHQVGIVHRDLKPENLMLTRALTGYHVKVLDFGIAQLTDGSGGQTAPGLLCGTPRYMAPEQTEGLEVDGRVDVYALGLVLYEALVGNNPFEAPSVSQVLHKQRTVPVPALAEAAPLLGLGPLVDAVIQRATAKRREDRYPSMLELAHALAEAAGRPLPSLAPAGAGTDATLVRTEPMGASSVPTADEPRGRAASTAPAAAGPAPGSPAPPTRPIGTGGRGRAALVVSLALLVGGGGGALLVWQRSRAEAAASSRRVLLDFYAQREEPPPPDVCREPGEAVLATLAAAAQAGPGGALRDLVAVSPEARYLAAALAGRDEDAPLAAGCPGFAAALNLSGTLAAKRGATQEAEARYGAALQASPDFLKARFNRGVIRIQAHRLEEAAADLREVVARQPRDGAAHYALGLALAGLASGEDPGARQAFCTAAALGHPAASARCEGRPEKPAP